MSTTEWGETVIYEIRRREEVMGPTDFFPSWQLRTRRIDYWLYEPGFIRSDAWVAAWANRPNRMNGLDGYVEAATYEEAVSEWTYRIAMMFINAIRANEGKN